LNIVTVEPVADAKEMVVYDAGGGFVIGSLDLGAPANFLILDEDPNDNIEVLLDTKSHIQFAVRDGAIVRNLLTEIDAPDPAKEKESRWLAYSPPPMAMPIRYRDASKWNRFESRPVSGIVVAAVAMDRQHWLSQDNASDQQVGDLEAYEGGEIRAFRFGVTGTLNFEKPWFYQLMGATHAFDKGYNADDSNELSLLDYRLDIPLPKDIVLSVGKQKEPISMERILLGTQMPMTERPAVLDAMFTFRNVGLSFSGQGAAGRVSWAAGVYNDWFDESQSFSESSNQVVGRITGLAYSTPDTSHVLHLGMGVRYNDAGEALRYAAQPEFGLAPVFVDTGDFRADRTITYDLEASWRYGPYWVSAEWVRNDIDAPYLGNPQLGGYHITGSWILTGEMRPYNRRNGTLGPVPVARSIDHGGYGAWELTGRYSSVDLSDGSLSGGEMDIFSLGLNWILKPTFMLNLNYRHVDLDRFGIVGKSDGLMGRVILMMD
jgi:phosphate-selective porin OprO/OprP